MKRTNLIRFKLVWAFLGLGYLLSTGAVIFGAGSGQQAAVFEGVVYDFDSARPEALEVKEVSFYAPAVDRDMKFNIVLPRDYESSNKRYPVLYMLHGLTSNYQAWGRMGVPEYLVDYDLIAVIPDAGNSWYVNWAESQGGQKNNWDDYIIRDLIGYVDSHYRTISRREGRAISGLSMGGYGALLLGLRHPDLFCSIGSHSGYLVYGREAYKALKAGQEPFVVWPRMLEAEASKRLAVNVKGFGTQQERTPKGKIFVRAEEAEGADPFKLVLKVPPEKLPHIYLDCGTEDGLVKGSQDFMKLLMENKIPFTYAQAPGGHAASYWQREVEHSIAVQYAIIQRNLRKAAQEPAEPEIPEVLQKFENDFIRTSAGNLMITFIGHGTLMFTFQGKIIHIDPVSSEADYTGMPKADMILITHEHGDHLDPKAIENIRKEGTRMVLTKVCADRVAGGTVMENGDVQTIEGLKIEAVPAYNIVHMRSAGNPYHPKGAGNGYVITFGDKRVYVAGDTENIPEMKKLEEIDIAFLPMNLPYTMAPEMAAEAARVLQPKILYPYHYGETDTSKLVELLKDTPGIEVRIRKMK